MLRNVYNETVEVMTEPLNTQYFKDVQNLCHDSDVDGFDLQAGKSWIYPTNFPTREYQYNIIEQALHKNTLVSLPTGLGKTFIAAVVMFNFFRWYPHGKIIFMAPTRPLVKQQIDACYNITAIPQDATVELTGSKLAASRVDIWLNKRVFFITPQVLQNDLDNIPDLAKKIKCLVFDEAHKAKGNHAYCDVIKKLTLKNKAFRVLGLSATPGNSVNNVLEVMTNLLIAHLEFRTEDSADVKPYVFERSLETVVVPFDDKIKEIRNEYLQILEKYTGILMQYKLINGNCANLTKGKMFMLLKDFQKKNNAARTPNYSEIMKSLQICVSLYHAFELLTRHGLRSFFNFFKVHIDDPLLKSIAAIRLIMRNVEEYLGPDPTNISQLPDGTFSSIPENSKFGHPKFYRLGDILTKHFKNSDKSSRVIVFFEYRDSVKEAFALLIQSQPTIRPKVFLGQGSGMTQKTQLNVVKSFREGTCNTLLSTCIGEEGLDVGDVDLIICFDISNKSPVRMIQRMGRTGRKKEGRIIVLVTEGKEQHVLKECLAYKNNLASFVLNSQQLKTGLYTENPPMIPDYIKPKCQKMHIVVEKAPLPKKNSNIKDLLKHMSSDNVKLDDIEIVNFDEKLDYKPLFYYNEPNPLSIESVELKLNFGKHLEKQRNYQPCGLIKHSKECEVFVSLLQFADSKRYNLPTSQAFSGVKNLRQGDIRQMFMGISNAPSSSQDTIFPMSQIENTDLKMFPPKLFAELSVYVTIHFSLEPQCNICNNLFKCIKYDNCDNIATNDMLTNWVQPDETVVDSITDADLDMFMKMYNPDYQELENDADMFDNFDFTQLEGKKEDVYEGRSFAFEAPKDFNKLLHSFKICSSPNSDSSVPLKAAKPNDISDVTNNVSSNYYRNEFHPNWTLLEHENISELERESLQNQPNFENVKNLGDFKDLSNHKMNIKPSNLSCESHINSEYNRINIESDSCQSLEMNASELSDLLKFFKLSSIEDLFASKTTQKSVSTNSETSPDLFESPPEIEVNAKDSESPILCTYDKQTMLKEKAKRNLFEKTSDLEASTKINKPNLSALRQHRRSFMDSPNKNNTSECTNSKTESQVKLDIVSQVKTKNIEEDATVSMNTANKAKLIIDPENKGDELDSFDISDILNMSHFGLTLCETNQCVQDKIKPSSREDVNDNEDLEINDVCDLSSFFVKKFEEESSSKINMNNKKTLLDDKHKDKPEPETKSDIQDITDICDISDFIADMTNKYDTKSQSIIKSNNQSLNTSSKTTFNDLEDDLDLTNISMIFNRETKVTNTSQNIRSQMTVTQIADYINKEPRKADEESSKITPKSQKKRRLLSLRQNVNSKITPPQVKKNEDIYSPATSTLKTKRVLNLSLTSNSDDEFENVNTSSIFAKPKVSNLNTSNQHFSKKRKESVMTSKRETKKPKKKLFSDFIEYEAEVSEDENNVQNSEDEDSGEDCYEASFVADETMALPNTQMHAHYLQSVKSPAGTRGKFKIPAIPPIRNIADVYSQECNETEENSYVNDSFCVDSEEADSSDKIQELSYLEILEKKLKISKKRKKRTNNEDHCLKRKKIIVISDDSE